MHSGDDVIWVAVEIRRSSNNASLRCFWLQLPNKRQENQRRELVSREEPADLEGLIALSIRIDNRIRERRRERLTQDPQVVVFPLPSPVPESR